MSEVKMNKLLKKREKIKSRIIEFDTYISNVKNGLIPNTVYERIEILQFKERLENIIPLLNEFYAIDDQLDDLSSDHTDETFEDSYYSAVAKAREIQEIMNNSTKIYSELPNAAAENNIPLVSNIHLPNVSLPKFNGEVTRWLEFRDSFDTMVHKSVNLTKIQKLYYLRSSLTDEAAQIISAVDSSANSYDLAWGLICDRFENKRMLIQSHIKAILNFKAIKRESIQLFREMHDRISIHLRALDSLGEKVEYWDSLLIVTLSSKFDDITAREWEAHTKTFKVFPKITDLKQFLSEKANMLENIKFNKTDECSASNSRVKTMLNYNFACNFCKRNHSIYACENFKALTPEDRLKFAKEKSLCQNCLRVGHSAMACRSMGCRKCTHKHNSLLHIDRPNTTRNNASFADSISCLLPTALVVVHNTKTSQSDKIRTLLDTGSQSNYITERLASKLNLKLEKINIKVEGINNTVSEVSGRCILYLKSIYSNFKVQISAFVVPGITGELPQQHVDLKFLKIPSGIQLADPEFYIPGEVDLLLGAGVFFDILLHNKIEAANQKSLLETKLGWIVAGNVPCLPSYMQKTVCHFNRNLELENQLKRFWEIEECENVSHQSDSFAETHFKDNYVRQHDGRFSVSIPFIKDISELGDSRTTARRQFLSLERRLNNNLQLKQLYIEFMREYLQLGHMRKINDTDAVKSEYFLPHHGVLKESSLTTKLRVVFNGSCATTTGLSLNSIQAVGPIIQKDLFSILLRFRRHIIALQADIAKMYRQVLINSEDCSMQRIFWRENYSDVLEVFELLTVTYGLTAASFLAIRCLHQTALDEMRNFPRAAQLIIDDFYVDDLLTGADTIQDASNIINDITTVLNTGCFPLRKWASNSKEVLKVLNDDDNFQILNLGENESTKTLGMHWDTQADSFLFTIGEIDNSVITKRSILAMTGQIFDPLGLLGPSTLIAKFFLQGIWQEKVGWDDPVSQSLCASWIKYRTELKLLNNIKIPRCIKISADFQSVQLHGFSDASCKGFGCAVYIVFETSLGKSSRLLASKSKVAPLKTQTIPRLELCGALKLATLVSKIITSFDMKFNQVCLWTDSMDVLFWLRKSPHLLKIFVANRVARIQELTDIETWRFVRSADNAADLVSRGLSPRHLIDCDLWWYGPKFLTQDPEFWPDQAVVSTETGNVIVEMKRNVKVFVANSSSQCELIEIFSSLVKAKRIIAYCFRFYKNCKTAKGGRNFGSLTISETDEALLRMIKIEQYCNYSNEIKKLLKDERDLSGSTLIALRPFVDSDGVLRVGGRLKFSNLSMNQKHPIILPPKSHLSKLILRYEHLKLFHAGPQQTLSSVRDRYWPIHGLVLVKKLIRGCVQCFKVKPYNNFPLMGDLPRERVVESYPFQVTGVDYAGPFSIKRHGGRGAKTVKCYLSFFVCFSTKACHIELVSDLSTSAFLAALRRFIARRGKPCKIWSDNATNFCGADNELKQIVKDLQNNKEVIESELNLQSIQWSFIPASGPHFGGIWESGIKRVKFHLKRIIGNTLLTFEEFYTFVCQVEAIMNSRPLHPLSNNPEDFEPLTPAHFLIGRKLTCLPENDITEVPENRLTHFLIVQRMVQHFWSRWRSDYLPELQRRNKWKSSGGSQLEVGNLVLIEDKAQPPLCWLMGRVAEIHPGPDGTVRVATVKTRTSTLRRPVVKLYPLPISS